MSTLGLTVADVEAVQNLEGIDRVMPAYSADVLLLTAQDDAAVTRVHSLPAAEEESLNRVELTSGRMPENPGECVIETGGYLFSLPLKSATRFSFAGQRGFNRYTRSRFFYGCGYGQERLLFFSGAGAHYVRPTVRSS